MTVRLYGCCRCFYLSITFPCFPLSSLFSITNTLCLLCLSFQWSSLVSSLCLWPLSPWLRSWLCSTTSWRSGWTPGSLPPSSDDRWRPRPETLARGWKSLTQWPLCLLLPMWVLYSMCRSVCLSVTFSKYFGLICAHFYIFMYDKCVTGFLAWRYSSN